MQSVKAKLPSTAQTTPKPSTTTVWSKHPFLIALIVLIGSLLLFFSPSVFTSNEVLFANDGPLGANMAKAIVPPQSMSGIWWDLNWLGFSLGSNVPNLSFLFFWSLGPVGFAKFYSPFCLLFLGLGAWVLFREMRWHPIVCLLGALAAMLNTNAFSNVAWGLGTRATCLGWILFGLASFEASKRRGRPMAFLMLSGLCVGMAVTEGADIGAIYSIYVAAFVFFSVWQEKGRTIAAFGKAVISVAMVAIFAGAIAAQTISMLIPTAVKVMSHTKPTESNKQGGQGYDYDAATQWSLPKVEAVRVLIPGIFGYRTEPSGGGEYWGTVGRQAGWEEHHQGFPRHSGSGEYAGVIVVLAAFWGLLQSLRSRAAATTPAFGSSFSDSDRKAIWFWCIAAFLSLLFAFGRHAPFYRIIYALPYFSTIRNPIKFMHPMHLSLLVLFGYGLQDLFSRLQTTSASAQIGWTDQLKVWWSKVTAFERRWVYGLGAFLVLSILGFLIFNSAKNELIRYLTDQAFAPSQTNAIFAFARGEIGKFVLFLGASIGILLLLESGALSGRRINWAAILLIGLVVIDLTRANRPWLRYYDYKQRYAANPITDILAQKAYEHRVTTQLTPLTRQYLANNQTFEVLMNEWLQNQFQYNNIHAVDIIQMPRMPEFDKAYLDKLRPTTNTDLRPCGRLWQLTNTRFVIGMTGFLQLLNQQIDPAGQGFRVHTTFDLVPKPGVGQPNTIEDITVAVSPQGQMALFEFTRALPRAALFSKWEVSTNDDATLNQLTNMAFDPLQTVVVASDVGTGFTSTATNQPGSVEFESYTSKDIKFRTQASAPSVLLLNDKYDSDWHVYVDGKPAPLLRCNYIMRGAPVPAGKHEVEFRYEFPTRTLYVTLAGIGIGVVLLGIVTFGGKPGKPTEQPGTNKNAVGSS